MKLYMAVTADEYELPLIIGSAEEVARFGGVTKYTVLSSITRKCSGKQKGFKYTWVEIAEDMEVIN